MFNLAWGIRVSDQFRRRVISMALQDGYDPSHVMAIMYFESKLRPDAFNTTSGATGLIQFMPSTAIDLNTTVEALRAMAAEEQLDYVARYFHRYTGRLKTLSDTYMAVLWPRAIGQPEDYVLFERGSKAYEQNKALDTNGDGKITKEEATSFVKSALELGMKSAVLVDYAGDEQITEENNVADPIQTVAGVASIFNPMVGGLIGLAGEVFKAFSPVIQNKVAKEINRHTDDPTVGATIAADFAKMVMDQAKVLTGQTDDFKAAAAIIQPTAAEQLKKIEDSVDAKIDRMVKAGDKASGWDQAMWDAQNKGKQTVSTIAIEEKRAGLWDMTRTLVLIGGLTASMIVGLIATAIVYQSIWGTKGIDVGLVGLGGPLLMAAIQCWKDIFAYRFDGTKESSDQSKALLKVSK